MEAGFCLKYVWAQAQEDSRLKCVSTCAECVSRLRVSQTCAEGTCTNVFLAEVPFEGCSPSESVSDLRLGRMHNIFLAELPV